VVIHCARDVETLVCRCDRSVLFLVGIGCLDFEGLGTFAGSTLRL